MEVDVNIYDACRESAARFARDESARRKCSRDGCARSPTAKQRWLARLRVPKREAKIVHVTVRYRAFSIKNTRACSLSRKELVKMLKPTVKLQLGRDVTPSVTSEQHRERYRKSARSRWRDAIETGRLERHEFRRGFERVPARAPADFLPLKNRSSVHTRNHLADA
jgi:hypothetical protein